jgi:hypothetical protein
VSGLHPDGKKRGEEMSEIGSVLKALAATDGVDAVVCVGHDGFVIDSVAGRGVDPDAIGAMVSTGLGAAVSVGRELSVGILSQAMMEYEKGVVIIASIGSDAVLAVLARTDASLGNVRLQVRKRIPELEKAL